jgi:hypothetical protein
MTAPSVFLRRSGVLHTSGPGLFSPSDFEAEHKAQILRPRCLKVFASAQLLMAYLLLFFGDTPIEAQPKNS